MGLLGGWVRWSSVLGEKGGKGNASSSLLVQPAILNPSHQPIQQHRGRLQHGLLSGPPWSCSTSSPSRA